VLFGELKADLHCPKGFQIQIVQLEVRGRCRYWCEALSSHEDPRIKEGRPQQERQNEHVSQQ